MKKRWAELTKDSKALEDEFERMAHMVDDRKALSVGKLNKKKSYALLAVQLFFLILRVLLLFVHIVHGGTQGPVAVNTLITYAVCARD